MNGQNGSRRVPARPATACTECQRRKQKCSREWPCTHCQARNLAHLCKFTPKRAERAAKPVAGDTRVSKNPRELSVYSKQKLSSHVQPNVASNYDELRLLGYLPDTQNPPNKGVGSEIGLLGHLDFCLLDANNTLPSQLPTAVLLYPQAISTEMENALRVIPPKPYADILVQYFLDNTNYHLPLTPELTCLVLRVCACSAPYLDEEIRQNLETELGGSVEHLSILYHNTAKQLSSTIGPGKGGLMQVQQLFLTAQWFKTEALFVESWHALGAAIHEAQELGMHTSSLNAKVSELDREMRRRLWCILYTWDWEMSLLLSRPRIINSSGCSFKLPNLRLETGGSQPESPSPLTHMVLQCQLGLSISQIPGIISGDLSSTQVMSVQQEIEKWFNSFPSAYSPSNPDTQWDTSHQFVKLQRCQLYVIGYMVLLMPLKRCLTKHIDPNSSSLEESLRTTAVENALKLLRACDNLLQHILPLNAKFHLAPFLMFDTASLLCSAILHDSNRNLPQRENVLEAITKTLDELGRLSERAKTGMICYKILKKLVACLPPSSAKASSIESRSPESSDGAPQTLPDVMPEYPDPSSCYAATVSPLNMFENSFNASTSLDFLTSDPINDSFGLADLPNVDLGALGQIWGWGNLDMDFPDATFI